MNLKFLLSRVVPRMISTNYFHLNRDPVLLLAVIYQEFVIRQLTDSSKYSRLHFNVHFPQIRELRLGEVSIHLGH